MSDHCNSIVVLSQPRSGSTMLGTMLDSHPDIRFVGELFMERTLPKGLRDIRRAVRRSGVAGTWSARHLRSLQQNVAPSMLGFKLMLHQHPGLLRNVASRSDVAKVVLSRENLLAVWSSEEVRGVTGQGVVRLHQEARTAKVCFNPKQFSRYVEAKQRQLRWLEGVLLTSRGPVIRLSYAQLSGDARATAARMLSHLKVSDNELQISTVRRNPSDILSRFTNPDAALAFLRNNGLESWAEPEVIEHN
jgi:LPS sulfotransferase NodH